MIDTHSIDDTDYNRKLHKNVIKFPANPAYEWSFLQSAGFLQPIDEQLKRKISELVAEGVRSVPEMSRHLSYYVKSELFRDRVIPEKDNRRFHPTKRAIRSHMYSATIKQQLSFIDQDNAASLVEKWAVEKPGDHFFFRPHSLSDEEQDAIRDPADVIEDDNDNDVSVTYDSKTTTLLFVHQTKEQRHLLERYGNNLCMLDATYKTTRYALPLFFVAVKTKVDYQPVASFVTQDESTASIQEALEVLKSWNSRWQPEVFFTDYCEQEIRAIENLFPSKLVPQEMFIL